MQITEKWIGKVAGWKMLKAGRDLWKGGAVKSVVVDENSPKEVKGVLGSGEKPRRVSVFIHSDIEVETRCACMHVRRTGEICSHAVALLLQAVNGESVHSEDWSEKKKPKAVASFEPKAFKVHLPPHFPEKLSNGTTVKFEILEGELISQDLRLCAWFQSIGLLELPRHLSVHRDYLADFFSALEGHTELYSGEKKIEIKSGGQTGGIRLPVEVDYSEKELILSLLSLENLNLMSLGATVAAWDIESRQMTLPNFNKSLLKPEEIEKICSGGLLKIETKKFILRVEEWEKMFDWSYSGLLEKLRVLPSSCGFVLKVEGSLQRVQAKLLARYPGGVLIPANIQQLSPALDIFPMLDRNTSGVWLKRNTEAESGAIRRLYDNGFSKSGELWEIEGEEQVLDFLSGGLIDLKKDWKVEMASRFEALQENIVRVEPDLKIEGSGQDWLAFDYSFKTDTGKQIPREIIEKMLKAGKRTGTSKNGKRIIISRFDSEIMSEVLQDVNPRQDGGKYYISKNQGAYINRIKSFYSKGLDMTSDEVVKKLPPVIQGMLRDYQKEGVAWLWDRISNESSALLADDMGLGKTLQTLCLIHLMRLTDSAPSLIVCPTSLLENWRDEALKFFPNLNVLILHGSTRHELMDKVSQYDIVITSYALIARDEEKYQSLDFSSLVIDEASIIRNPDTQSAKALRKLQIKKRVALTGTPLENALQDLWSIFEFMMPKYLGTREDFKNRYVKASQGTSPDLNVLKRLRLRLEPFMLRRTKREVATELPPKIEQILWCQPSDHQLAIYKSIHQKGVEKVSAAAKQNKGGAHMQMLTILLRLRQACCDVRLLGDDLPDISLADASAKLVQLMQLVNEAKQGGHRILIFSQFTSMLALIKEALDAESHSYCYLDGSTKNRGDEVKRFQSASGPLAFLISLKAGGYGLNLTAADMVVHFDPWWNPAVEAQATDRAYRIGQSKPVNVYKLVTKGTVEEKIINLQEQKKSLIGAAVDENIMMTGLSSTEISSILD